MVLFALPETARSLVGNGSIPAHGINRTFVSFISERLTPRLESGVRGERPRLSLPNPLASLKMLLLKDVAIVLVCNGIYYMIYCCVQASLSSLFIEVYHYGELVSGLVYIPFGVACLISLLVWGKVLDYDYARLSKHLETESGMRANGADEFPIEKARLNTALYLVGLNTLATIGYGWAVAHHVVRFPITAGPPSFLKRCKQHVSAPLIFQAVIGFATTGLFSVSSLAFSLYSFCLAILQSC